jgi:hypothetical protein
VTQTRLIQVTGILHGRKGSGWGLIILNPIFLKYWANNKSLHPSIIWSWFLLLVWILFRYAKEQKVKKSDSLEIAFYFTLNKLYCQYIQIDYIILKKQQSIDIIPERFSLKYKLVRYYNV